jgi:hypothetical protein
MLTTACPGNRRTGYCAGSGTTHAPARLRTSGAGAARGAGLSLAGADVLLDGFGRLAFERRYCLGSGAKAKQGEERSYAGEDGLFHKDSTAIQSALDLAV